VFTKAHTKNKWQKQELILRIQGYILWGAHFTTAMGITFTLAMAQSRTFQRKDHSEKASFINQ
jgi:hypothetical protein